MASPFRLTVDQIVAAISLLDEGEQSELRLRLLGWLAGQGLEAAPAQPSRPATKSSFPMPRQMDDENELDLYDDLMALGEDR